MLFKKAVQKYIIYKYKTNFSATFFKKRCIFYTLIKIYARRLSNCSHIPSRYDTLKITIKSTIIGDQQQIQSFITVLSHSKSF